MREIFHVFAVSTGMPREGVGNIDILKLFFQIILISAKHRIEISLKNIISDRLDESFHDVVPDKQLLRSYWFENTQKTDRRMFVWQHN